MQPGFRLALAVAAVIASLAAGTPARAADPIRVGETFLVSGIDPTKGSNGWALISHGVGEKLFAVDSKGRLVPELATGAEKIDANTWRITLAAGRKFSDGSDVTADVVTRALANTVEQSATARGTGGKLAFAVIDARTFTVTTERPVALAQALFAEWALVVYKLKDDGSAIFSGPYQVAAFTADQSLALEPNPHFPGAAKRSPATIRKFTDAQSLALAFEAGQLDIAFGLPSEVMPRLRASSAITVKSFPVAYQYMAWFNTRRPQLADTKVRRALDLGIDRKQLALAINGGVPATGAFAVYFPFAEETPRPFDLAAAKTLLDEAGWKAGGDGIRAKDGKPLAVTVLAYPQRPDLVAMLPVVRAQFRALGIDAQTRVVENVGQVAGAGDFDVLLWAMHTAPSGDPAFFLNGMLRTGAGINYSGYSSAAFDGLLDRLARESDPARRIDLTHQAEMQVFADAPVAYLLTPEWHVGLSKRLAGYEPWGSDYHVLRADIGE